MQTDRLICACQITSYKTGTGLALKCKLVGYYFEELNAGTSSHATQPSSGMSPSPKSSTGKSSMYKYVTISHNSSYHQKSQAYRFVIKSRKCSHVSHPTSQLRHANLVGSHR